MRLAFTRLPVKDYWQNRTAAGVKLLERRRDEQGRAASVTMCKPLMDPPGTKRCDYCGNRIEQFVCTFDSEDWPHPKWKP